MKKNNVLVWLLIALMFVMNGCASIISGKYQDVEIKSNPSGAMVLVNGMQVGKTPLVTEMKRKKRHEIKFQKEGYVDEIRMTKRGYNWWNAGNIILGGIIGIIIDFATGAVYSVEPEELNVSLLEGQSSIEIENAAEGEVKTGTAVTPGPMEQINSVEKLAELKEKGILTEEEFQLKKKEILNV